MDVVLPAFCYFYKAFDREFLLVTVLTMHWLDLLFPQTLYPAWCRLFFQTAVRFALCFLSVRENVTSFLMHLLCGPQQLFDFTQKGVRFGWHSKSSRCYLLLFDVATTQLCRTSVSPVRCSHQEGKPVSLARKLSWLEGRRVLDLWANVLFWLRVGGILSPSVIVSLPIPLPSLFWGFWCNYQEIM